MSKRRIIASDPGPARNEGAADTGGDSESVPREGALPQPAAPAPESLFPAFERYAREARLVESAKGALAARYPRILGQGRCKAEGLDRPPSALERRQEFVALDLRAEASVPQEVIAEQARAEEELKAEELTFGSEEGKRRLVVQALRLLSVPSGQKDNQTFAGRLILKGDKSGLQWSWNLTQYYPIVSRLPPDPRYIAWGHEAAESWLDRVRMEPQLFEERMGLAYVMAKYAAGTSEVLISDVARLYKVAAQGERFWNAPRRSNFEDLPDAAFIANLLSWRRSVGSSQPRYELVPSTVHQALGPKAKAFYIPTNAEGTEVRPVIYLRQRQDSTLPPRERGDATK